MDQSKKKKKKKKKKNMVCLFFIQKVYIEFQGPTQIDFHDTVGT